MTLIMDVHCMEDNNGHVPMSLIMDVIVHCTEDNNGHVNKSMIICTVLIISMATLYYCSISS